MTSQIAPEVELQRKYYAETAREYDSMHLQGHDEHFFALCLMLGAVDFLGVRSILDVGSGTGRAIAKIKAARPDLVVKGIEPVGELRNMAYAKGIAREDLVDGDALALPFADGEFDLVCEFGVLHHIRTPALAIDEMLRVARKAIFISDSNSFGQGGGLMRGVKQALDSLGLWPLANYIKTGGRGYSISEGDGLAYSYSVFTNYDQIERKCERIHITNTMPAGINPYRTAGHVALLGVKR